MLTSYTQNNILRFWPDSAIFFLLQWQRNLSHPRRSFDIPNHTMNITYGNIKVTITNLIECINRKGVFFYHWLDIIAGLHNVDQQNAIFEGLIFSTRLLKNFLMLDCLVNRLELKLTLCSFCQQFVIYTRDIL